MSNNRSNSRRSFLKQCAALNTLGYASAFSALGGLNLTSQVAHAQTTRPSEYKAIVCVYLTGGNDLNMLIPTDDDNFNLYRQIRGDALSLSRQDNPDGEVFIPITSGSGGSQVDYGLHPSCGVVDGALGAGSGGFKKLYDQGNLAFIANTGSLLEPTTVNQFKAESVNLPPSLFNHLVQKDFVRAGSYVNGAYTTGWAGRISDLYNSNQGSPLNITLLGDNIWQRGERSSAYGFNGSSVRQLVGYRGSNGGSVEAIRRAALDDINNLAQLENNLFVKEYGRIVHDSLSLSDRLRDGAQTQGIELTTEFPNTVMGARMKSIAELINAREGLSMPQQVFYVDSGGWDMHDDLIVEHAGNLQELSAAMTAFYQATVEMGLQDQVVTFTNSDFGRTLDANSTGSDHGWGGTQLVMGGRVNGGQVVGEFPLFTEGDGETQFRDFRGTLVPSIATDQVSSTIAKWFGGFSDATLNEIFPNVSNFNSNDLGFIL